jgi:HEAT repeat protein
MSNYMYVPRMLKNKDVAGLIKLLGSKAIADRNCAAEALGKLGGADAANALVKALQAETQPAPVSWMISALKEIGRPAVKPLLSALMDGPDYQSKDLHAALAAIGAPAVPVIVKSLALETGVRRKKAITALSHVGGDAAAKILLEIVKESDAEQSTAAAEGLKRMNWQPKSDARGVETLTSIGNWAQLAEMGPEGIAVLCRELVDVEKHPETVRLEIAGLLGKTGGAEAVSALKTAYSQAVGRPQVEIGRALAQAGGTEITDFFIAQLPNSYVAAIILGELKDPRATRPLMNEWVKKPTSAQIQDALQKLSRCPGIDPAALQEYQALKARLDQQAANLANPVWVLENMPTSPPSRVGNHQYTRQEFLERYPTLESYAAGNYQADFCLILHGLVDHCTVARTGANSWEVVDQRHEDTDW